MNMYNKMKSNFSSQKSSTKNYGLTSPISLDFPDPLELSKNKELVEELNLHNVFESDQELNHRMSVLGEIHSLVETWIKTMALARYMPKKVAEKVGGKVYAIGSFRLGVHSKGSDIDALCVAPSHINRSDFFDLFYYVLKNHSKVTDLIAVENAFVPVIKMKFDGIEIDMLFAKVFQNQVTDNLDLLSDNVLKNLNPRCVRSLNGYRTTEEILRLIPNVENFKMTLRTIKLWAKSHGIYSNVLGFIGGVSWAMLVARTCQLYPNAVPATLVRKFFLIFSMWEWPLPVFLKSPSRNNLGYQKWDPHKNVEDRLHLMPIVTPAYPQQNSTFNVTRSTLTVMVEEIKNGLSVTNEIMDGKATWDKLFKKSVFFNKYKHFMALIVYSSSKEDHLKWCAFVQSKIRLLVASLEKNSSIQLAHINSQSFDQLDTIRKPNTECTMWFVGLQFIESSNLNINLTKEVGQFVETVTSQARSVQILKESMNLELKHLRRKDLRQYLPIDILKRDRELVVKDVTSANGGENKKRSTDSSSDDSPSKKAKLSED